jgi:hypothetical protein
MRDTSSADPPTPIPSVAYSVFQGFRFQVARRLFLSQLLERAPFFEAAEAVAKISLSLKSNHHKQI